MLHPWGSPVSQHTVGGYAGEKPGLRVQGSDSFSSHRWGNRGPGTAEIHLGRSPGLTPHTVCPHQGEQGPWGQSTRRPHLLLSAICSVFLGAMLCPGPGMTDLGVPLPPCLMWGGVQLRVSSSPSSDHTYPCPHYLTLFQLPFSHSIQSRMSACLELGMA